MSAELVGICPKLVDEMVYLMIEAIYLCSIGDDAVELVEVVIELFLQVGGAFHLFLDPDMSCGFQKHHLLLLLQLLLGFVCVHEYHSCQYRVIALGKKTHAFPEEQDGENNHSYV